MATRKWTKQQRAEASEKAKIAHARRKLDTRSVNDLREQATREMKAARKRDVRSSDVLAISGWTAVSANQAMAIDVVKMIAHDVPADVIVKVVERILR